MRTRGRLRPRPTDVGGYRTIYHNAIQNAIFLMARDAGLKAKQDPNTRDGFSAAVPTHQRDEFRRSGLPCGGFRGGGRGNKRCDIVITLPDEEANPSLDPAFKKLLFGKVKTIGRTSDYHRESDDLLNEMEHGSRAIHYSVRDNRRTYEETMAGLDRHYHHRPADDAHLPKGPFVQLLHRNGGIKTFIVGAFNEASKELLETTKMCANIAADRALANGTASSKAAANALHLLEYKNRIGCAMTKAHANRMIVNMISCLALCSTDPHTAKKLHDDARAGQQPYSFYKCPDSAMDLDREHRNRANQHMFHKGVPGAGPSTRRRFADASQTLRRRFADASQTLRRRFADASQTLRMSDSATRARATETERATERERKRDRE